MYIMEIYFYNLRIIKLEKINRKALKQITGH